MHLMWRKELSILMVNDLFMEYVLIYCLDVIFQLKCEYCGGISPEFRRICKEDLVQNDAHLVERVIYVN